jgi:Arc/MetJ-type ribon-helix-helix transcriptional regulator
MRRMMAQVTVGLGEEELAALQEIVRRRGVSQAEAVREALRECAERGKTGVRREAK